MPPEQKKPHPRYPYMTAAYSFRHSYSYKLGFYLVVLALPMLIMAAVETFAADSPISVSSGDPTRFLAFLVYFVPGLVMVKPTTDSWWRMVGVLVAYTLISPAYYIGALELACQVGKHCVSV